MRYRLGRFLQVLGMIIVPVALAGNIAPGAGAGPTLDLKQMLLVAGAGMLIFYVGYLLVEKK